MNHHRKRRPQQRVPQPEQERMQQVLQRLKCALQLGLKPSFSEKVAGKRWCNTDAEVQLQALRAIAAFVSILTSHRGRHASLQVPLEECVATLQSLLGAERETVFSKAADVCEDLIVVMGDGLLGYGGKRLVGPLARLLKCSKLSIVIAAATALHGILLRIKPGINRVKAGDDSTWKALEDADVLAIVNLIQDDRDSIVKDNALMDLIAVIVERWPEARYRVGCNSSFRTTLLLRCTSNSDTVAQIALRAASALALCGCVATLLLKASDCLWSTISSCLHSSKDCRVQLEAFRFLTSLSKASTFGALFSGPHVAPIVASCLRGLELAKRSGEGKWYPELEFLIVEAAHTTSSILSWPGTQHSLFLNGGIEELLLLVLSGVQNKGDKKSGANDEEKMTEYASSTVERRSRANKLSPTLRPLLWEILGWLGAHHCVDLESSSSPAKNEPAKLNNKLIELACASWLRALCKRGQSPVWFEMEHKQEGGTVFHVKDEPVNSLEVVQICKAVLLLLSSPSQVISSQMRMCLETTLTSHGLDWLPTLVKTTALGVSKTVKLHHVQSMTNLLAVACVSWVEVCRDQLLKLEILRVILGIIQGQTDSVDQGKMERLSAMRDSFATKACCVDSESWEGNDCVLFTALWALPKLLQGSDWAKKIRESMSEEIVDTANWSKFEDGDFVHMLSKLAGDRTRAEGVRWWSACSLSCFGVYGFPSKVGQDVKMSFDDPLLADVIFVLGDGSRLAAHGVVLASRCETLLPAELQVKVCENLGTAGSRGDSDSHHLREMEGADLVSELRSTPAEIHVSPRLSSKVLKIILEYVYAGIVCIPYALVADTKLVAKRCRLEPLTSLLQGKSPIWGKPSAPFDLSPALGIKGHSLADVLLRAAKPLGGSWTEKELGALSDYVPAHRFILSARCQYFQALFRSGMRDSTQKVLEMQASKISISKLLHYLYSGASKAEAVNCSWTNLDFKAQLEYLQSLLELADLAGQWLMDELQQTTCALIGMYLKSNVLLCPPVMSLAFSGQLWMLVETCAACLAPEYVQLRNSGALDNLNDELTDFVRAAHVKLFRETLD
ncbi:hypothetical protein MPTK1_6g08910 [Marchantia polymorpha subsp. ruderalis]|uniref:BTB domain-containing protein n=2 Tax=Marchantia polymorpha TaxID=3197 RepID=A0AAF6BQ23_MARPO|nr:hypothetical protein MARPO_0060s0028 [Marchantia polymorpha]BBN14107.1 hypothetical protein Mp_6g08910 [Marchantia polymorpha subsp. ruderalis]|eukprot:PTQ36936.1 hypothetical protein MARPO_0060s0028 [Marchantia polymorpha]